MKKNHLMKIISSLIVKFSCPSQELLQVKFINCYLREYISFTPKMTLETGASLPYTLNYSQYTTPDTRQSKTLLTLDERGSNIARNSIFDCHLSPSPATQFLAILGTFFDSIRLPPNRCEHTPYVSLDIKFMLASGVGRFHYMGCHRVPVRNGPLFHTGR